jgi:hypothetical protein
MDVSSIQGASAILAKVAFRELPSALSPRVVLHATMRQKLSAAKMSTVIVVKVHLK